MVEIFCARFRQEDAFRDLKQRLGWEECRAWTRNPIERTTQAVLTTLTALRLLQLELQEEEGDDWWLHPPWNPHKSRPSVLDMERLLRDAKKCNFYPYTGNIVNYGLAIEPLGRMERTVAEQRECRLFAAGLSHQVVWSQCSRYAPRQTSRR